MDNFYNAEQMNNTADTTSALEGSWDFFKNAAQDAARTSLMMGKGATMGLMDINPALKAIGREERFPGQDVVQGALNVSMPAVTLGAGPMALAAGRAGWAGVKAVPQVASKVKDLVSAAISSTAGAKSLAARATPIVAAGVEAGRRMFGGDGAQQPVIPTTPTEASVAQDPSAQPQGQSPGTSREPIPTEPLITEAIRGLMAGSPGTPVGPAGYAVQPVDTTSSVQMGQPRNQQADYASMLQDFSSKLMRDIEGTFGVNLQQPPRLRTISHSTHVPWHYSKDDVKNLHAKEAIERQNAQAEYASQMAAYNIGAKAYTDGMAMFQKQFQPQSLVAGQMIDRPGVGQVRAPHAPVNLAPGNMAVFDPQTQQPSERNPLQAGVVIPAGAAYQPIENGYPRGDMVGPIAQKRTSQEVKMLHAYADSQFQSQALEAMEKLAEEARAIQAKNPKKKLEGLYADALNKSEMRKIDPNLEVDKLFQKGATWMTYLRRIPGAENAYKQTIEAIASSQAGGGGAISTSPVASAVTAAPTASAAGRPLPPGWRVVPNPATGIRWAIDPEGKPRYPIT